MARTYRLTLGTRIVNRVYRTMTALGLGARHRHILSVRGGKSGRPCSTPVDVMELGGHRWLVAGYGMVNWVRNVRASGQVTLSRGGRSQRYWAQEMLPWDAVPVLRQYMSMVNLTRRYFDASPASSDEAIAAEARSHPVFRLDPVAT